MIEFDIPDEYAYAVLDQDKKIIIDSIRSTKDAVRAVSGIMTTSLVSISVVPDRFRKTYGWAEIIDGKINVNNICREYDLKKVQHQVFIKREKSIIK